MPAETRLNDPKPDIGRLIETFGDLTDAVLTAYGTRLDNAMDRVAFLWALLGGRFGARYVSVDGGEPFALYAEDAMGARQYLASCVARVRRGLRHLKEEWSARDYALDEARVRLLLAREQEADPVGFVASAIRLRTDRARKLPLIAVRELKGRGWTRPMVAELLGEHDGYVRRNHWLCSHARAYAVGRVEAAESSPAFRARFLASLRRRSCPDEFRDEVLARSEALERSGAALAWKVRVLRKARIRGQKSKPAKSAVLRPGWDTEVGTHDRRPRLPQGTAAAPVSVIGGRLFGVDWTIALWLYALDGRQILASGRYPFVRSVRPAAGSTEDAVAGMFPDVVRLMLREWTDLRLIEGPLVTEQDLSAAVAQATEGLPERARSDVTQPVAPSEAIGTVPVCVIGYEVMDAEMSTSLRLETTNTLQVLASDEFGWLRTERPASGSAEDAVSELLPRLVGSMLRWWSDLELLAGPLVTKERFDEMVAQALEEQRAAREANRRGEDAPIVVRAEELGLHPRPGDRAEGYWEASCPETNHSLVLNTKLNEFYCGYCKHSGDADELGEFRADRVAASQVESALG